MQEWKYETSIFKEWTRDDEEKLLQCFEFDWGLSKCEKLISNYSTPEQINEFK